MQHTVILTLVGSCLLVAATGAHAATDRMGDPLPQGAVQRLGTLRMKYNRGLSDICYLPDGRGVVALGSSIHIWDLAKGKIESTHKVCDASLSCLQARKDGSALLFADRAGNVVEWDVREQSVRRRFPTGQKGLRWAFYSPDETRVLTTGTVPPTLKAWDLATGKELVSIEGDMAIFMKGIYGPDGKTAFVGGGYNTILAHYDLTTGKKLKEWFSNYRVYDLCLSSDGKRLLAGSRSMASEWQIDGYKLLKKFTGHHGGAVNGVAYCQEPEQILTGSRDGSIRRWDRVTGKVLLRWFPHESYANIIRVSPDGRRALSYGAGLLAESDLAIGKPRLEWERHAGAVYGVAFTPDGRQVVSGSADGTLRVWDVATAAAVRTIEGVKLGAHALAVSPDGTKVAAGAKDSILREFSLADGTLLRELAGHRGYVRSAAYSHDGTRLLSSADDGSVRVWVEGKSEPAAVLEGHRGGVLSVAVSPDDRLVASGGRDGTVRLWDLAKGLPLRTLEGHRGWVEAVAFAGPNLVLSGGRDSRVLRWDTDSGKLVGEATHGGGVYGLACSPDGTAAYSVGSAPNVTCWRLPTGEKAKTLNGHEKNAAAAALSPDGKLLVTASADATLLVWDVRREP